MNTEELTKRIVQLERQISDYRFEVAFSNGKLLGLANGIDAGWQTNHASIATSIREIVHTLEGKKGGIFDGKEVQP